MQNKNGRKQNIIQKVLLVKNTAPALFS